MQMQNRVISLSLHLPPSLPYRPSRETGEAYSPVPSALYPLLGLPNIVWEQDISYKLRALHALNMLSYLNSFYLKHQNDSLGKQRSFHTL